VPQSHATNGSDKLLANLLERIDGVLPVYSINEHQWQTRLLLARINQWWAFAEVILLQ
jgi:hypothetical protein